MQVQLLPRSLLLKQMKRYTVTIPIVGHYKTVVSAETEDEAKQQAWFRDSPDGEVTWAMIASSPTHPEPSTVEAKEIQ